MDGGVLQARIGFKVSVEVRQLITFCGVDVFGDWDQVPEQIMGDITPGQKMVERE